MARLGLEDTMAEVDVVKRNGLTWGVFIVSCNRYIDIEPHYTNMILGMSRLSSLYDSK